MVFAEMKSGGTKIEWKRQDLLFAIVCAAEGAAAFCLSWIISEMHPTWASAVLIISGLFNYMLSVKKFCTMFDVRGVFAAVWLCSIGLSCLRFNEYQLPWSSVTWVCLIAAYIAFELGFFFELNDSENVSEKGKKSLKFAKWQVTRVSIGEKALFTWLSIFFAGLMICLGIEAAVCGFIPIFSSSMDAYVNFMVFPFHYFTVSAPLFFPISYYYLKKFRPSGIKKTLMILFNVACLLVPFLIVSRQLYVLSIIVDMFIIGLMEHRKEASVLCLAIFLFVFGWFTIGKFRNQSNEYVEQVFTEIQYADADYLQKKTTSMTEQGKGYASNCDIELPDSVFPVYMYVAFNFDNFNYLVDNIEEFSNGRQAMMPLLVYTRLSDSILKAADSRGYVLLATFNTYPFICSYYRDFGITGVALGALLTGVFCAWVMKKSRNGDIVWRTVEALTKYSVLFCFFGNFFLNVTMWFYVFLLIFIWHIMNLSIQKIRRI